MTALIKQDNAEACLYLNQSFAAIGNIKADSQDSLRKLLSTAAQTAKEKGCKELVAPLDGDTWHSYRTIIYSSGAPKFFLEPDSLLRAELLEACGFELIAKYSSSLIDLNKSIAAIEKAIERGKGLEGQFTIRPIDGDNFESELAAIYKLSIVSFANNFLYQSISLEQFASLYRPIVSLINEKLIWLAFDGKQLVGLLFALPDCLNQNQIVVKTVAVHPNYVGHGIASYLLARTHEEAIKQGFSQSIQALYKDENNSAALTAKLESQIIRRYGLFALNLDGARQ